MKKILLTLAVLVILLGMINCENEQEEEVNPFIGTWEGAVNKVRYIITDTNFTCLLANNEIYYTGTYTYNETHITIVVNAEDFPLIGNMVMHPYAFNDDGILSLDGGFTFLIKIN